MAPALGSHHTPARRRITNASSTSCSNQSFHIDVEHGTKNENESTVLRKSKGVALASVGKSSEQQSLVHRRNTKQQQKQEEERGRGRRRRKRRKSNFYCGVFGFSLGVILVISLATVAMFSRTLFLYDDDDDDDSKNEKQTNEAVYKNNSNSNAPPENENKVEDKHPKWDLPFVHILNTRFMQSQGRLHHLSRARLELFRTFCLPTVLSQTSQNFLWIIKTDSQLHPDLRHELIDLISPYPHYFLMDSNTNYLIGHERGAWRGGMEGADALNSTIYSGDVRLLRAAHEVQSRTIVLETRLDADDGLNAEYMSYVQRTAMDAFLEGIIPTREGGGKTPEQQGVQNQTAIHADLLSTQIPNTTTANTTSSSENQKVKPHWMYWCSKQHLEWYYDGRAEYGQISAGRHTHMCITPGITVGFNVGTNFETVPQFEHEKIARALERRDDNNCGVPKKKCLIMVRLRLPLMAIRSRTPTSAGMMGVLFNQTEVDALIPPTQRRKLWAVLPSPFFNISFENLRFVNDFIRDNIGGISSDNLKGQCTRGHSCKLSSKEMLQRMSELAIYRDIGQIVT